jgi:hypothetical protein
MFGGMTDEEAAGLFGFQWRAVAWLLDRAAKLDAFELGRMGKAQWGVERARARHASWDVACLADPERAMAWSAAWHAANVASAVEGGSEAGRRSVRDAARALVVWDLATAPGGEFEGMFTVAQRDLLASGWSQVVPLMPEGLLLAR